MNTWVFISRYIRLCVRPVAYFVVTCYCPARYTAYIYRGMLDILKQKLRKWASQPFILYHVDKLVLLSSNCFIYYVIGGRQANGSPT